MQPMHSLATAVLCLSSEMEQLRDGAAKRRSSSEAEQLIDLYVDLGLKYKVIGSLLRIKHDSAVSDSN